MLLTTSLAADFIIFTITFWVSLYFYYSRNFNYWKERNVEFIRPIPFFGSAVPICLLQKSIGDLCWDIYRKTKKSLIGLFIFDEPYLLLRDPELIKSILIKDFGFFNNRTMTENKEDDPMGSHILFILKTPDWREMRRKISPVFTSGKLKLMYSLIRESGEEMLKYLDKAVEKNPIIDTRDIAAKYSTDAITSTAFGINAHCFENENSEFRKVSSKVFNWHYLERGISTTCYFLAPALVKLFKLKFVDTESATFLRDAFWTTMRKREEVQHLRNDLLDILIEIRKNEDIDDPYKLEGDKLVAQATQFFLAGYETTSTTISFTLYELALNPKLQEKVREEIICVKNKHKTLTYEVLKEMDLLDRCIKETLRKYPALPFLDRRCNVDYNIPGTDIVLKKGTAVLISLLGLHYDPQYFEDPVKYDPDRFLEENVNQRPFLSYMPFGEGPRNCIGARFGSLSSKSAVAHILSEFEVNICEKTQFPMKFDPKGFLIAPIGGLPLEIKRIKKC